MPIESTLKLHNKANMLRLHGTIANQAHSSVWLEAHDYSHRILGQFLHQAIVPHPQNVLVVALHVDSAEESQETTL